MANERSVCYKSWRGKSPRWQEPPRLRERMPSPLAHGAIRSAHLAGVGVRHHATQLAALTQAEGENE